MDCGGGGGKKAVPPPNLHLGNNIYGACGTRRCRPDPLFCPHQRPVCVTPERGVPGPSPPPFLPLCESHSPPPSRPLTVPPPPPTPHTCPQHQQLHSRGAAHPDGYPVLLPGPALRVPPLAPRGGAVLHHCPGPVQPQARVQRLPPLHLRVLELDRPKGRLRRSGVRRGLGRPGGLCAAPTRAAFVWEGGVACARVVSGAACGSFLLHRRTALADGPRRPPSAAVRGTPSQASRPRVRFPATV